MSRVHRLIVDRLVVAAVTTALVAGLGGLAAVAPAAAHSPDPIVGGALFAQDQRVGFRWRAGAVPVDEVAAAIKAAAADANASRASRAATFVYDVKGTSQVGYGVDATCGVNGIACFDRSGAPASFTMWLREHGRTFDWGTLKWCQMYDSPPNGCYDARTIALDEFGHVQILGHHLNEPDESDYLDAVVQTVSRTKPKEGWDMHAFGRCDVATLQREYDVPTTATPLSTCLDLDTGATLKADDTSVTYGQSITLTATLKVIDRTAYGRLGGNWLSFRSVRLQRRVPGATTWSALTTMTPASAAGTYVATTTVSTTFEYRAVFATPSTEGLNGDTSPTVRVTVFGCGTSVCPQSQPSDGTR
jgi:hypothetical protein